MSSTNKLRKTDKRHHWGRGGNFLKGIVKLKRVAMFNSSMRKKIKQIDLEEDSF